METSYPVRWVMRLSAAAVLFLGLVTVAGTQAAPAQVGQAQPEVHGRLLLVLPFENRTNQPNLGWIAEAAPEVLNRRLASVGFSPLGRDDRLYALDHLGLPQSFQPSRASALRLAQTLDANYVIVGTYTTAPSTNAAGPAGSARGNRITASARILNVDTLHMSAPVEEQAELARLLDVLNGLAWRLARELDPRLTVAQNTFVAADSTLRIDTFENYIRGLVDTESDDRLRHLKEAVRLDPSFTPALFALGQAYFADQQYEQAAATLGRMPKDNPRAREADFYRGLAYFYLGSYGKAADAFAFVSRQLPLAEVLNNEAVAESRRGKDGTALLQQAIATDPNTADYQFNLALALRRKGDVAGATRAVEQALKLHPQDSEAIALAAQLHQEAHHDVADLRMPGASARSASLPPPEYGPSEPLERVQRTFNETSFREAAQAMEQMDELRLASLPPARHAAALTDKGTQFLNQGLLLEAEREFQAAIAVDSGSAAAHAGLAVVRERGGDTDAARQEAQQSTRLQPNVTAELVLARLDMQANQMPAAANDVGAALKLEPGNSAARGLRQLLEAKGQRLP